MSLCATWKRLIIDNRGEHRAASLFINSDAAQNPLVPAKAQQVQ